MTRNQLKGKTLREIVQMICPTTIGDGWAESKAVPRVIVSLRVSSNSTLASQTVILARLAQNAGIRSGIETVSGR